MSEIFEALFARRHEGKGLSLDTLRMVVRKVTLEEFTKLYYSIVFNRESSRASTEKKAFLATKHFVHFRQMAIISRAYGMFCEVVKKFMGEITDDKIYRFQISDYDYQCVRCEWFWRYRNNDFEEDKDDEEHRELLEYFQKQDTWINSINSDRDFEDYITAYRLGKKEFLGFKFDGKEYPITLDMKFNYGKYSKVKNAIWESYNKKHNQLKTEEEYLNIRIDTYRNEEDKYGRLYSVEAEDLEKLKVKQRANWLASYNIENDYKELKNFDDSLRMAFEKADKENVFKENELRLYPYLKEVYEAQDEDEFFKWDVIWEQRKAYLS